MTIDEFEREVNRLLKYTEDGFPPISGFLEDSLELFVHIDGCLGCRFRGELIPCEGVPWRESLQIIVDHIKKQVAILPAGEWEAD